MTLDLIPHVDEYDGECSCGIDEVTPVQQQLLTLFDDWYGDKAYRKHREICGWADKLTGPLLAELQSTRAKLADLEQALTWHTTCLECGRTLTAARQETARAKKAEAALAQANAKLAAVRDFAEGMRGYCSPHGVSVHYADQLTAVLDSTRPLVTDPTDVWFGRPYAPGAEPVPSDRTGCLCRPDRKEYCEHERAVDGHQNPCPYTHAHTRYFCGRDTCRES